MSNREGSRNRLEDTKYSGAILDGIEAEARANYNEPVPDLKVDVEVEPEASPAAAPVEVVTVKKSVPRICKLFEATAQVEGSDLHLKSGARPRVRIRGQLRAISKKTLSSERIESMMFEIMDEEQKRKYRDFGSVDFAYQLGDADRFRINLFRQRGKHSMVARRVSKDILDFESLHLPPSMNKITEFHQGLVLLSGTTGSGKSTTIAAALDYINANRACHIVTIEDPIEYLFTDKKAFINQREIGIDVPDFSTALKALMREDPDVVLIGEMRDEETFHAALHAAETGHLVFGTVHASGAAQTITRLLDLLPEGSRDLIRQTLVFNLKAVVGQKLLPTIREDVARVPSVEIMLTNPVIRKMIDEAREDEITDVIKGAHEEGMMDFNESLRQLVEEEFIDMATAYAASPNADELKMRFKGIRSTVGRL